MDKKSKVIIVVIVSVIVLLIGLFLYSLIFSNKSGSGLGNNSENAKLDEVIPKDLSEYDFLYYDYDRLYNYYFKMQDVEEKIIIDSRFNNVKIENNKLLWNVDGNWIQDQKIVDDIEYFIMNFSNLNGDDSFVVLTKTNKLFVVKFSDVSIYNNDNNTYLNLTSDIFQKIDYKEIELLGKVSRVNIKHYVDCESYNVLYFEINKDIFVLQSSVLKKFDEFIKSFKYINDLDNNCYNILNDLKINFDSSLDIFNDIRVIHYVYLFKPNGEFLNIVVGKDNNLYLITKNDIDSNKLLSYGKVKTFDYKRDITIGKKKIIIKLSSDKEIELVSKY